MQNLRAYSVLRSACIELLRPHVAAAGVPGRKGEPTMHEISDPKTLTVADFMTKQPATALADLTLEDARERMYLDKIRHLCVVDDTGALVGILSQRDVAIAEALDRKKWKKVKVGDAMVRDPVAVAPTASVVEVAELMEEKRLGSVVVVEDRKPVGVFTTTDAMRVIRSLVAGVFVDPIQPAEHLPPKEEERPLVPHYIHLRDLLDGARPSPNMGKIGGYL